MKKLTCLLLLVCLLSSISRSLFGQTNFNGYLDADVTVGEYGESKITVRLNLPKGTAGLQPMLSLSYNSQAKNGIAGLGWNLEGVMQSITRTAQTYARDNQSNEVAFGGKRTICLERRKAPSNL